MARHFKIFNAGPRNNHTFLFKMQLSCVWLWRHMPNLFGQLGASVSDDFRRRYRFWMGQQNTTLDKLLYYYYIIFALSLLNGDKCFRPIKLYKSWGAGRGGGCGSTKNCVPYQFRELHTKRTGVYATSARWERCAKVAFPGYFFKYISVRKYQYYRKVFNIHIIIVFRHLWHKQKNMYKLKIKYKIFFHFLP